MSRFPELIGIALQVAQMIAEIERIRYYKEKLEDMADQLKEWADEDKEKYLEFREKDPDFYNYYQTLPDYAPCESNILRAKGAAFNKYGNMVRNHTHTTRGFAPLGNVLIADRFGYEAAAEVAVTRASTHINEQVRVDDHVLERWSAIVSAPIGVEAHQTAIYQGAIAHTFKSLISSSQSFNSAGVAFGASLFNLLNTSNNEQQDT